MSPRKRAVVAAAIGLLVLALTVGLGQWLGGRFIAGGGDAGLVTLPAEPGCSPVGGECVARRGAVGLHLAISPNPSPMEPFAVRVRSVGIPVETVAVAFEMPGMEMGLNRYRLHRESADAWSGKPSLPVCGSGRIDWIARVSAVAGGKTYVATFPFRLQGN